MKDRKKLIIVLLAIFIIGIITFIVLYNGKKTNVIISSKFTAVLTVDRLGNIKDVKLSTKDAKFITKKLLKGKNLEDAPKILINKAIEKKYLNKEAYSYNMEISIDSHNKKIVNSYTKKINKGVKGKLKNKAFIELEYVGCTCQRKECSTIKKSC